MPISAVRIASPPFSRSSTPTCGPTNSTRRISIGASLVPRSVLSTSLLTSAPLSPSRGAMRISTSVLVPNDCTWASGRSVPASVSRMTFRSGGFW